MKEQKFADGSVLTFEEEGHAYTLYRPGHKPLATPDVPSVSTIAAFDPDKPAPFYAPGASSRGTLIHKWLEWDEMDKITPEMWSHLARHHPRTVPFIHAWREFVVGWELDGCELLVWGDVGGENGVYVGQCDRVYRAPTAKNSIVSLLVDLKTSPRKSASHPRQVEAYAKAYQQRYGKRIDTVGTAHLCERKGRVKVDMRLVALEDRPRAMAEFCQRLEWWREAQEAAA